MNNYCINLKKRKNKPYCKIRNEEITFLQCKECDSKEYKKVSAKFSAKVCEKKSTSIKKSSVACEQTKTTKNKKNRKKLTVTKETYNFVIERDNYSCRLCGSNNWLQLHHILYRSQRKDLINDVNNCIMLCEECHRLVHSNKKKWQPILIRIAKDTTQHR